MKNYLKIFVSIIAITMLSHSQELPVLLDASNLKYIGAFNVPSISSSSGGTFAWAGKGLAYNPQKNTLFMTGHDHHQLVAEISIPKAVINNDYMKLPSSKLMQPFIDITEGHMSELSESGKPIFNSNNNIKIGGLLVQSGKLFGNIYAYYEGAAEAKRSHFSSSLKLSESGDFRGMYKVGKMNPGLTAGYMAVIPESWQSRFKAKAITGNACIPIISRSSFGPSLHAFTPELMRELKSVASTELVYYTEKNPTLGTYVNETEAKPVYNMTTTVDGVIFPEGFRTVLFLGSTGVGVPEYGAGTSDKSKDGKKVPNYNEHYVFDPANPHSKGPHAWPYTFYAWAYDVEDLLSVKKGIKKPWDIIPYKHWAFKLPYTNDKSRCQIGGVAFDEKNNLIYISQLQIKKNRPVIHVFKIVK